MALRRAVHQIHDRPLVFDDSVTVGMLADSYPEALRQAELERDAAFEKALRAILVARSRYAQDNLRSAIEAGVRQYVLLGTGLDTFAYRNPYNELRVFEVDHPATQAWKRELLERSRIPKPAALSLVPVDFEDACLAKELRSAGFDLNAPALFSWLGVVPYLTLEAFRSTVRLITACPRSSGVVLDYGQPQEALSAAERATRDALAARVEKAGEPFRIFFTPPQIAGELADFQQIEDLGSPEINARYFNGRRDGLNPGGSAGRLLCAWK